MDNIKLYEISPSYIDYLVPFAPHLFYNASKEQQNSRKYIGVIFQINNINYFAPLSSFKSKHKYMKQSLDFIKIKNYAVINLNNMIPVPVKCCTYVNISKEKNPVYKALLLSEYRYIKSIQEKIRKNAVTLYNLKISNESSKLTNRCADFKKLEELCLNYK